MASEKKAQPIRVMTMLSTPEFDHYSNLYSLDVSLFERIKQVLMNYAAAVEGPSSTATGKSVMVSVVPHKALRKEELKEIENVLGLWRQMSLDLHEKATKMPGVRALVVRTDVTGSQVNEAWELNSIVPMRLGKLQFVCDVVSSDEILMAARKALRYISQHTREAA